MSAILAAILVWIGGCAIAGAALRGAGIRGRRLVLFAVGLAPGAGFGLASLVYFYGVLAGFPAPGAAVFIAVTAAVAAVFWRGTSAPAGDEVPASIRSAQAAAPIGWAIAAITWTALVLSVLLCARTLWRLVHAWPEGTWDAVAIWNVRARFLYHGAGEIATLLASVEPSSHPHYPLLLPGSIAAQYAIVGAETAWTSRLVALGFALGLAVLAHAVASETGMGAAGALATALIVGTPWLWVWAAAQVADVIVAYLFLGTLAVLASQLGGYPAPQLPPLLGGFLLGLLAWTKDEGVVMAGILFLFFALAFALELAAPARRRACWTSLSLAAGALPGVGALIAFKRLWAPPGSGTGTFLGGDWADRLSEIERWWTPTKALLSRLLSLGEAAGRWAWLWPALGAALVIVWTLHRGRPRPWLVFWTAVIAAVTASWIPIYAVTPYDQAWHIAGSIDRLLLQIMPATAVGVVLGGVVSIGDRGKKGDGRRRPGS